MAAAARERIAMRRPVTLTSYRKGWEKTYHRKDTKTQRKPFWLSLRLGVLAVDRRLCVLGFGFALLELFALLFEDRLAAQLDLVAFEGEDFDQDLVAFLELVADVADSVFGDLADVQQAVGAGENFDEGAEIHQAD